MSENRQLSCPGHEVHSGTYTEAFENQPGIRISKDGFYAGKEANGVRAEIEAKGPNASAGAEASEVKFKAMARAEIGSISAKAGPVGVKLGLGVDTGVSAGVDGVEVKVLGTGFSIGEKNSVSVLGSEVSCVVM